VVDELGTVSAIEIDMLNINEIGTDDGLDLTPEEQILAALRVFDLLSADEIESLS